MFEVVSSKPMWDERVWHDTKIKSNFRIHIKSLSVVFFLGLVIL